MNSTFSNIGWKPRINRTIFDMEIIPNLARDTVEFLKAK